MLSVKEAAQMLGVSDARVRALIASGSLPATKVGRAWVLREEDVLQRVASRPQPGRPKADEQSMFTEEHGLLRREQLKELYLACREAFKLRPGADELLAAETQEEAAFYVAVADFFLQQRQAELVKAKVF